MLIDTHVHLDAFPDSEIEAILGRGHDVGVGFVICAGTTVDSSIRCIELSRRFHPFFSGVGINFRLWRILLRGVADYSAQPQRLLQLLNLCLGEVEVVFKIQHP